MAASPQVESGRYHVYVGNACPWCHRVVLTLILRGLTQHISMTWAVDDPTRASRGGWVFDTPEPVFGKQDLRQVCIQSFNSNFSQFCQPTVVSLHEGLYSQILAMFAKQRVLALRTQLVACAVNGCWLCVLQKCCQAVHCISSTLSQYDSVMCCLTTLTYPRGQQTPGANSC